MNDTGQHSGFILLPGFLTMWLQGRQGRDLVTDRVIKSGMSCVPGSQPRGLTIIIILHAVDDDSVQNSVQGHLCSVFQAFSQVGWYPDDLLVKGMNFQSSVGSGLVWWWSLDNDPGVVKADQVQPKRKIWAILGAHCIAFKFPLEVPSPEQSSICWALWVRSIQP